jgi:hypothetical protein
VVVLGVVLLRFVRYDIESIPIIASQVHYIPSVVQAVTEDMRTYKASIARAAAPRIPTAWVACAAPPVNWLGEGVALVVTLPVGIGVATADDATDATDEAADSTTEEASDRIDEATDATDEATEAAAEEASEGAALLLPGMVMGTPAAEQVDSTADMAAACSDCEQAP